MGASAGGLEAFTAFLKHLPADSGMAFVLIQHLDPQQPSQLTELLSKASRMPVEEVRASTVVKANHVYVIAPGVSLTIEEGRLEAEPREAGRNLPIDHFLRSLAREKSSNAIGIVLSGTASDGTLGLKAVKAEGGVTFAQEPSSAKFDGMPRSAIAAKVVDFVLTPPEIARRVVRLALHPYVATEAGKAVQGAQEEAALNQIGRPFATGERMGAKAPGSEAAGENARAALEVQKAAERMLLAQYAPAGVIVDDALNVVHVRGETGSYLHLAPGEPTYNLLKMARKGLVVSLRTAFIKARQNKTAVSQLVRVRQNGTSRQINLKIIPINGPMHTSPPHFMVLFEQTEPVPRPVQAEAQEAGAAKPSSARARAAHESARLKQELAATKEYLQSIIEEQEASGEELRSANEEAQASNEELETAKEELQSANEELNTVNEELRTRDITLTEVNNDLSNVLSCINVGLVMVGRDLRIRRFTPAIEPLLNLTDSDIGRSISDLKPNIEISDLPELLRSVIEGVSPVVREILGPEGRWYSMQALPYRVENNVDGALLVLHDINAVKHGRDYAEAIVETIRQPLVILSRDLRVKSANRAFYEKFRVSPKETENRSIFQLGNGQFDIPRLREALERILPESGELKDYTVEHEFEHIGWKTMVLSAREIEQPVPYGQTILLAIEDVTERSSRQHLGLKEREHALASELEPELARVVRALTLGELAASIAHEVSQPLVGVITNAEAGLHWLDAEKPNLREAQASLELIVRDGNRASEVIRRIRGFMNKDEQEPAVLDINEVVQEAVDLANADIARSGIALRVEFVRNLPPVRGHRIQLQQVVLNLLVNSRDAMAASANGNGELVVSTHKSADGVHVAVRDSGGGVESQHLGRIFDAFFTTRPKGMGIGLSISRSIIEAHGGRIWATPNDGAGLTVEFSLPVESERPL